MNRIKSIKQLTTGVIVLVGLTLFVILLNSDTKRGENYADSHKKQQANVPVPYDWGNKFHWIWA